MSKAFTKESDAPEDDDLDLEVAAEPPGAKNYITPAGYQRLRAESAELWDVERPKLVESVAWAASNGDRSENADYLYGKRRLREIDRQLKENGKPPMYRSGSKARRWSTTPAATTNRRSSARR